MRRPIAATTVAMLIGCATVASLVAPLASAEDDVPAVAADDSLPNTAPTAVDDDAVVTSGGSVVVDVLGNDTDPDGDPLSLVGVVDPPASGTTSLVDGGVEYLAAPGYAGPDSFTYEISDGELTAVATVSVTVTSDINTPPSATDDGVITRWGSPVTVDVTANDTDADGDHLAVVRIWRPEHGGAQLVDGQVVYTPRGQFVGVDAVRYQVGDGRGGVAEAVLAVQVDPDYRVELKRTSTPVALRPMTVRGTVSTQLGGPVTVSLQRRAESGAWRTLRSQRLRDDNQFALSWTPPRPGRELLRLRATWTDGPMDVSTAYRAQVEARFAPVVEPVRRDDVPHTWRPGCPVGPAGLRQIHMSYWDYQGRLRRGTLIGAAWVVGDYLAIFRRAFDTGFPIKKMYPADRYGGVDERAMRAGNTSAFNCRHVTGNPYRMSQHSYGNAIDINTFENPYVTGSRVYPPKAAVPYHHRREHNLHDPGVITRRSSIARELWRQGWAWGARWSLPDYQHWSSNGG